MKRFFASGAAAGLVLMSAVSALAHAKLEKAEPAVGSVGSAPAEIRLSFTEGLELKFCTAMLTLKTGEAVPVKVEAARDNPKAMRIIPAVQLVPGTYAVTWHVVSVDSHKTDGHFSITVTP